MIAQTLQCRNCGSRLTVSAVAPKVITCSRCLYRMMNPHAGPTDAATPAPPLPMRVLPLESQATGDAGMTNVMLIVMVVLLAAGAFVSAATLGVGSATFNFLLLLLMLGFVVMVIVASYRKNKHDLEVAQAVAKMPQLPPDERETLSYQSPAKYDPYHREPTNGWAAAGGFFASIVLCAGGFFLLAATSSLNRPSSATGGQSTRGFLLLVVIAAVIGYMIATPNLAKRPGWRGFGLGATIGLTLGMLALGPCAFCYLITLGG